MRLTIKLDNKKPVELQDFAQSMLSLGAEYRHFVESGPPVAHADEVKLYIKSVRTGSIEAELSAIVPLIPTVLEHASSILEFAKHLKSLLEWLKGGGGKPAQVIEKSTLENVSAIVEPAAKDNASQLNIGALNINGNVEVTINLSSTEANAVQNNVRRELEMMVKPKTGIHEKVVVYWAQARSAANKAGNKARIESIRDGDVNVVFTNDALKVKMLYEQPYPFGSAFIVDVAVETVQGKPVLYKVLALHGVIGSPEEAPLLG